MFTKGYARINVNDKDAKSFIFSFRLFHFVLFYVSFSPLDGSVDAKGYVQIMFKTKPYRIHNQLEIKRERERERNEEEKKG